MATANPYVGAARAALGQGLAMGWGDEAEAWLRSKLAGSKGYEAELAKINQEYAQYSKENPFVAPALEFGGGAAPALAAMLAAPVTGGATAPAAAAAGARSMGALSRLAANPYARGAVIGGGTGAVAGAGSAKPGERGAGATSGAVVGTVLGTATPAVIRAGGAGAQWLRDRVAPSEATVTKAAVGKVSRAVKESGMTPAQVEQRVLQDRARNIPSTIANADPALVDLAETVAQRSGPSGRIVEKKLGEQTTGARERTYTQTRKGLQPGQYYDDLKKLQDEMRAKADPLYKQAYSHGEVNDPAVLKFLELPQFKQGIKRAEKLLKAEGRELDLYREVVDPKTGEKFKQFIPTVETLDQVKRGLDTLIEKETDSITGKVSDFGRVYINKKNEFLNTLDSAVPDYGKARAVYKGDAELAEAMRSGMNDFNRLDHEQVIDLIGKMGAAEKDAFRTGVVRDLYSKIMDPSGNINAAQRIIGSPEMQAKLQPLFDSPAKFDMFRSALEREAQLFQQSNRILGGAATGRRTQARERFEEGPGVGAAVADAVSGGFWGSLTNMAARLARSANMTDEVAEKVGRLLMSSDPHEVAAAVKLIDQYDVKATAGAARLSKGETGAIMGTATAFPPSPIDPNAAPENIEAADIPNIPGGRIIGPDIDADIEAERQKMK